MYHFKTIPRSGFRRCGCKDSWCLVRGGLQHVGEGTVRNWEMARKSVKVLSRISVEMTTIADIY